MNKKIKKVGIFMKKEEVINAILYLQKYKTETDRIEAKSAILGCPNKLYDTISAFSNKNGGIIIFGINEENGFSVDGVYDANDLQNKITNLCSQSMEPVVRPEIITFEYSDKYSLKIFSEPLITLIIKKTKKGTTKLSKKDPTLLCVINI